MQIYFRSFLEMQIYFVVTHSNYSNHTVKNKDCLMFAQIYIDYQQTNFAEIKMKKFSKKSCHEKSRQAILVEARKSTLKLV